VLVGSARSELKVEESVKRLGQVQATTCGECEACILNNKLTDIREWFPKMGDHSKKRLMLGLLRRFHSTDLLHQLKHKPSKLDAAFSSVINKVRACDAKVCNKWLSHICRIAKEKFDLVQ
jgi:hypothetical protein